MSFGFSVGDFITVGSLAYQIITALSDSRGSRAEYKELTSVLSSLRQTLEVVETHFLELASSGDVDVALYNALRHQLGLCTAGMEDFLLSSQKYTESFLPDDRKRSLRREFRKISYYLFKGDDVQKLYTSLQRHIQALLMLMNAATGKCLVQTKQLVVESHAMTERAEQQVTQLAKKFEMLKSIAATPPRSLGYTWEGSWTLDQAPVFFEDALGRSFTIPLVFCRSMDVFHEALKILFRDVPGQKRVAEGEYEMMDGSDEGSIIEASNWEYKVLPGGHIAMNIVLRVPSTSAADIHICPKCRTSNRRIKPVRGVLYCLLCQFCFRISDEKRIVELPDQLQEGQEDLAPTDRKSATGENLWNEEEAFRRVHYLREELILAPPRYSMPSYQHQRYPELPWSTYVLPPPSHSNLPTPLSNFPISRYPPPPDEPHSTLSDTHKSEAPFERSSGRWGMSPVNSPPPEVIDRSGLAQMTKDTNKASTLAEHFEQLSREFRKERAREDHLVTVERVNADPMITLWAIDKVDCNIWGFEVSNDEMVIKEVLPEWYPIYVL